MKREPHTPPLPRRGDWGEIGDSGTPELPLATVLGVAALCGNSLNDLFV